MERQALLDRRAVLEQEREIRKAQAVLQQRQVDDHITQLNQQLAGAEQQRAALVAAAERIELAAMIAQLQTLKADWEANHTWVQS